MTRCEHIELTTDDPARARDFYAALFQWTIGAMPDGSGGEYLMFQTTNGGGGITGKMAPEQPTAWMPYFTVASVNRTLDDATRLGASVQLPYTPIGDMGAVAVLRDPTGAAFGLWETAPKPAAAKKPPAAKKPAAKKPAAKKPAPAKKKPAPAKKKPAAKKRR